MKKKGKEKKMFEKFFYSVGRIYFVLLLKFVKSSMVESLSLCVEEVTWPVSN